MPKKTTGIKLSQVEMVLRSTYEPKSIEEIAARLPGPLTAVKRRRIHLAILRIGKRMPIRITPATPVMYFLDREGTP